jgi:uncharacterized membrane protein YphA (DoxX/SURF4 family)
MKYKLLFTHFDAGWICISIIRILLGCIFLWAGLSKAVSLQHFFDILSETYSFPYSFRVATVLMIPGLEICVGIYMIIGYANRETALIASALMALFFSLSLTLVFFGNSTLSHCGCFGAENISWLDPKWNLVRNLILLIITTVLLRFSPNSLAQSSKPTA